MPKWERMARWRILLRLLFSIYIPEKEIDRFHVSLRLARFDCCLAGRLSGAPQRLVRTAGLQASSGLKQILVLACSRGTGTIEIEGHVTRIEASDIAILDLARRGGRWPGRYRSDPPFPARSGRHCR
jgi:hypothetical protein